MITVFAALMFGASRFLAKPLSMIFVGYDPELLEMTLHAFSIYAYSFFLQALPFSAPDFLRRLTMVLPLP